MTRCFNWIKSYCKWWNAERVLLILTAFLLVLTIVTLVITSNLGHEQIEIGQRGLETGEEALKQGQLGLQLAEASLKEQRGYSELFEIDLTRSIAKTAIEEAKEVVGAASEGDAKAKAVSDLKEAKSLYKTGAGLFVEGSYPEARPYFVGAFKYASDAVESLPPPPPAPPAPAPATPLWVGVVIALGGVLIILTLFLISRRPGTDHLYSANVKRQLSTDFIEEAEEVIDALPENETKNQAIRNLEASRTAYQEGSIHLAKGHYRDAEWRFTKSCEIALKARAPAIRVFAWRTWLWRVIYIAVPLLILIGLALILWPD